MQRDPLLDPILPNVAQLSAELDKRGREARDLMSYDEGCASIPTAVINARLTRAYKMLMPMSDAPWGSLIVGSSLDRLEVAGIRDTNQQLADKAWGRWQDNMMDAESRLLHHSTLVTGRAFALIWGSEADPKVPEISLDNSEQMIVQYAEGSRRRRVAALRRWLDGDRPMANYYTPTAIYKLQGPKNTSGMAGTQWERRLVDNEEWPLPHKIGRVPVVEYAINRRLKAGSFGFARGEFANCTGLIDRIQLLTFLGLVVAMWMGFPLRGVIGDKILRDDDGNIIPPFDVNADSVFQLENPNAKIAEYQAADRKNLSVYAELDQLATITRTPRHYFPLEGGMSNIAADTIRANEGSLHAKINGDYKPSLGESHEETLRLCNMIAGDEPLSARAELQWKDHESRSLAERADAVTKLSAAGLPWPVVAELALDAGQGEISRWEAEAGSSAIGQLLRDAQTSQNGSTAPPVSAGA